MQLAKLLDGLGYSDSPNFLRPTAESSFEEAADFRDRIMELQKKKPGRGPGRRRRRRR